MGAARSKNFARDLFGTLIVLASLGPAFAGEISSGVFLQFAFADVGFSATGCDPADPMGPFCAESPGTAPLDAPPWTFTAPPAGAVLQVTDVALIGDQFEVFDEGSSIGMTSVPFGDGDCGFDPEPCLADSNVSQASFLLAAGAHAITIIPVQSPNFGGTGFLRIQAIPLPSAFGLAALAASILLGRRRALPPRLEQEIRNPNALID